MGGAFMVFYEEQKERAGRNLSLLQGAQEYTLGDIPFGLEGCFRLGKRQCDYLIKLYLSMSA